jgi:hypothetical protein
VIFSFLCQWVLPNVMASFHSWKRSQIDDNRKAFEQGPQEWLQPAGEKMEDIHVFVCTDESDLRPLAVLINSSMANCP